MKALTIVTPFADFQCGQQITDPETIDGIMNGHNAAHAVQVNLPDPEPEFHAPLAPAAK